MAEAVEFKKEKVTTAEQAKTLPKEKKDEVKQTTQQNVLQNLAATPTKKVETSESLLPIIEAYKESLGDGFTITPEKRGSNEWIHIFPKGAAAKSNAPIDIISVGNKLFNMRLTDYKDYESPAIFAEKMTIDEVLNNIDTCKNFLQEGKKMEFPAGSKFLDKKADRSETKSPNAIAATDKDKEGLAAMEAFQKEEKAKAEKDYPPLTPPGNKEGNEKEILVVTPEKKTDEKKEKKEEEKKKEAPKGEKKSLWSRISPKNWFKKKEDRTDHTLRKVLSPITAPLALVGGVIPKINAKFFSTIARPQDIFTKTYRTEFWKQEKMHGKTRGPNAEKGKWYKTPLWFIGKNRKIPAHLNKTAYHIIHETLTGLWKWKFPYKNTKESFKKLTSWNYTGEKK